MDAATAETLVGRELARSPLSVLMFDAELRICWANRAAKTAAAVPAPRWRGRRLSEVLPGMDARLIEQSLRRVLATGETVLDLQVSSASGDSGGERFWSCLQFPVEGTEGKVVGIIHMMREVTARTHDQHRLALADQASARIGTTLDTTRTAEELLDVAIPRLADVGAVDLLTTVIEGDLLTRQARGDKIRVRRVAMRWPQDSHAPLDYASSTWLETDPTKVYHHRLVAGLPTFLPAFGAMSPEQLKKIDSGTGFDRMVAAHAAGAHSLMVVPLTARGVIMGLVVLYSLAGSRPFTGADLALAQDLVSRAAVSIDNARLYTRERASALTLQRDLLPRHLPEIPGLELAHRYVPAETTAEAGGDWFDVIALGPGRCALIVGDVTGHDMRAASLMGQLRIATRTLAGLNLAPSEVLARLNLLTADLTEEEIFATCIYAVHDASTGVWHMARAGHPPPALLRPGHSAEFVDLPPGMPLGVDVAGGKYQTTRVQVPPRSTLTFYTDGLIEGPATDIDTGMAGLADALTSLRMRTLNDACETLVTTLARNPTDDIAVLMARTR